MKITTKNTTTVISGFVFIILGIIFISSFPKLSYLFFGIGILIEVIGVSDEIKDVLNKPKKRK